MDDLCRQAAEIGLAAIDLVDEKDWPTVKKYGMVPAMNCPGAGTIPVALNRTENHDKLEKDMRENIAKAAAAKLPNVITFSGNRKGQADDEGRDNCVLGLKRVVKVAEDAGVTICLELLNSKVDHKDYQCDHTKWGVDVCKAVGSPRLKLLYDIYHMQIMEGDADPHDPRQYPVHRPLPHGGAFRDVTGGRDAGIAVANDRAGDRGLEIRGLLRTRIRPGQGSRSHP